MNDDEIPKDFTGLAVAMGVVQEGQRNILQAFTDFKKDQVKAVDDIRAEHAATRTEVEGVKTRLTVIESQARPKTPWFIVVSAIGVIVTTVGGGIGLLASMSQIAAAVGK